MEVTVHWCKWCCLVRWRHESPRSMSCQHLWAHSPAPCRAPCPGVTLPASPECPSPQSRGWLWGGWSWSRVWAWRWSSVWAWVLALVGARCRGLCVGLLPRPLPGVTPPASPGCPTPQTWGWLFDGRLAACWWTPSVSMAWASLVFDVVGVVAGRGVGRRVACPWPSSVSVVCSTRVFDVVGVVAGRGVGCPGGRGRCWWCGLRWCSTLWAWLLAENWVVVRVVAGRSWCRWSGLFPCSTAWFIRWPRIGSLYWPVRGRCRCRWGWLFVCSMMWARLLAEDWVVVLAVVGVDGVFHKSVR